ncbi:hypothetical protein ABPG77_010009, partial [Micractinium sp. CCAP 211/92]
RGFTSGEVRLAFEVRSAAVRLELLGTLYTFCRTHEKQAPQVSGIAASELESSAAQYNKQVAEASVGQTARVLLKEAVQEGVPAAEDSDDDAANPLWGQREDKQIQSLLEMVAGGAASMDELQQRLETELAALEDASVHEILENGAQVSRVLGELGGALGLLEDLEENLGIFDAKLRHMREDIAAIEDRNNQLELHSRNNQKLLATLEALVGRLALPEGAERVLGAREVNAASLPQTVAAAWELHTCLQLLQELPGDPGSRPAAAAPTDSGGVLAGDSPLPHSMASMSAVVSQRQHLHSLQRTFVDKAAAFLQQELGRVADGAPQRPGAAGAAGLHRPGPADHSSLRRRAGQLAPLLEVVGVLRPAAVVAPREAYCQAVNALLKQEAAAADAGGAVEPDLLARPSAAEAASPSAHAALRQFGPSRAPPPPPPPPPSRALIAAPVPAGAGIVPLHEGYQALLDSQLPALAEEAAQCVALLFPRAADAARTAGRTTVKSVRFAGGADPALHQQQQQPVDACGAEVQGAVATLLAGIDAELLGLIDGLRASRAVLCLPVLGATLAWRQRLEARGLAARPLVALLRKCEDRLAGMLTAFFSERATAIQRYDGRSSSVSVGGGGVKAQHVLPFILKFPAVAGRIEELLERWPPQQAQQAQQAQHPTPDTQAQATAEETSPPPAAARGGAPGGRQLPPVPSPFESSMGARTAPAWQRGMRESTASELSSLPLSSEADDISFIEEETDDAASSQRQRSTTSAEVAAPTAAAQQPPAAQHPAAAPAQQAGGVSEPGPGDVLRELVDSGYQSWLTAMGAAVEALGASDAKHGARLRLENHAFLQLALQALPLDRSPALRSFAARAAAQLDSALGAYVEQQVEHLKLARVLEFGRRLDELVESAGPADVPLQPQFQPAEVRQLLAAAGSGLDKRLVQEHQAHNEAPCRHLTTPGGARLEEVLEAAVLDSWVRLERQVALCYRGIELRPLAEELRRMFRAAAASGAASGTAR